MWVIHTRQAFQLTFLLEQPTAYIDVSARVRCKLAPVLAVSTSNNSRWASWCYVNKHASPCVCEVPDQRKPNARHVRAQRWGIQHVARASCTTSKGIHWHRGQKLLHPLGLEPLKTWLDRQAASQWGSGVGRVLRWPLSLRGGTSIEVLRLTQAPR